MLVESGRVCVQIIEALAQRGDMAPIGLKS